MNGSGGDSASLFQYAGGGNDQVTLAGGANWVLGGPGNDVLIGGRGADALFGEGGKDLHGVTVEPMVNGRIGD